MRIVLVVFVVLAFAGLVACSTENSTESTKTRFRGMISKLFKTQNQGEKVKVEIQPVDSLDENQIEASDLGSMMNKIKGGFQKVEAGIDRVMDMGSEGMKKGMSMTIRGIEGMIGKERLENALKKLDNIHLPAFFKYPMPDVLPEIDTTKFHSGMIPCILSLKSALPGLADFARAAAKNKVSDAVTALMGILKYMPDVSGKCIGKKFEIPPGVMNKTNCIADVVELGKIVSQLAIIPENVISDFFGIKRMIHLVPQSISECTGAL